MSSRTPFLEGSSTPLITGDMLIDALVYTAMLVIVVGVLMVVAELVLASGILQVNRR